MAREGDWAGFRHGDVATPLTLRIAGYDTRHALGTTVAAETGFTLRRNAYAVRTADVAFVSRARLPRPDVRGFAELAPDLAVMERVKREHALGDDEVGLLSDAPEEYLALNREWRAIADGEMAAWYVSPGERKLAWLLLHDETEFHPRWEVGKREVLG